MKILTVLGLLLILLQTSCAKKSVPPSFIILAVESLGFEKFSCSNAELNIEKSGLSSICQESVRFTHAYTPSVLTQPALASLLTGLYPSEHGLRHNGNQYLSAKKVSVAELAVKKGYRSAFFSGGPPLWRKSGLNQGFEVFNDKYMITQRQLYRPAHKNFQALRRWLQRVRGEPFFTVAYFTDLQFPNTPTLTETGQLRSLSYESQLHEFNESLGQFIEHLKKNNLWNNTHIILTGLNGSNNRLRNKLIKSVNLFAENSQVPLFIKPARKKRDLGIQWKIDKNISLVDVGQTLFDLLGAPVEQVANTELYSVSLKSVLSEPETLWKNRRLVLMETAWPQWRGVGKIKYALRRGQFLVIHESKVSAYNTLTDRLELTPLSDSDPMHSHLVDELSHYMREKGFGVNPPLPKSLEQKLLLAKALWLKNDFSEDIIVSLRNLLAKRRWDEQLWNWLVEVFIKNKAWEELVHMGEMRQNKLWQLIGHKRLNQKFEFRANICEKVFVYTSNKKEVLNWARDCSDKLLLPLLRWSYEKDSYKKEVFKEKFIRGYKQRLLDVKIHRMNYVNNLSWSTLVRKPDGPSLVDLYLLLPRNKFLLEVVQARTL